MYIAASIMSEIKPGQTVLLEKDFEFDEVAVKKTNGSVIGFILHNQPNGCVSAFRAMQRIGNNKVLTQVAVISGDVVLLAGQTNLFEDMKKTVMRPCTQYA